MKSTDFQIQIPKPCDANWNEMTPNEQGKFCSLCDKTVVDFTKMSDEEIKHFFKIKKKEERVCGHFYSSQVVVLVPKFHQFLIDLYTKIETDISIYLFRKPALFGLGLLMAMVGCETKTSGEVKAQSKKDTTETAVKDTGNVKNIRNENLLKDTSITFTESVGLCELKFLEPETLINDGEGLKNGHDSTSILIDSSEIPFDENIVVGEIKIKKEVNQFLDSTKTKKG